ncbi:FGGY family carbohydrate kinase [Epibacterium ulvae]|uniref:FGGY family carbohydrate kinase n=1 Tax=Epibacterium ulvae TaxID=1156985 RepID=UPI00203D4310|nr:FGGY family carbohydrate kinase [Epibacterium ulvae]
MSQTKSYPMWRMRLRRGAQAFALSKQGESCLAWDARTGTPISPIIVWQDARTTDRCPQIAKTATNHVATIARLPVTPYFSASKLGWIMENIPQAAAIATAGHLRLGTTDVFLRDRLTGRFETDVATASRTSLMNLQTGQWDADLRALFGVPINCLPKIGDCSGDLGAVDDLPLVTALGRPASGPVWPWGHPSRADQIHLWHRGLCPAVCRAAMPSSGTWGAANGYLA